MGLGWRCRGGRFVAVAVLAFGLAVKGQSVPQPDATVGAALRSLASRAGVVFVGQVVGIQRKASVVEIHFHVEQAVSGVASAEYVLREWAGLWPPGQMRYHVGDRAMIFLNPSAPGKFSTPVDGAEGVLPVVLPAQAGGTATIDVRRLATRVLRAHGESLADTANGAITLQEATEVATQWQQPHWHEPIRRPLPKEPVRVRLPITTGGGTLRSGAPVRVLMPEAADVR